jgi:polyisoprenoid-binding protein YceI
MKNLLYFIFFFSASFIQAQNKYFSKDAKVHFFSDTKLEKIEGTNNKGVCVLDASTGALEMSVLVAGFKFEKALMEEHFQENYMEISKFPKSGFKGKISNIASVNFEKDGSYPVDVTGQLTIHGVTKDITTKGKIEIAKGVISASSTFDVACEDYNIAIAALVRDKIAKSIKIDLMAKLQKLQK